jgi:hypothetical protein
MTNVENHIEIKKKKQIQAQILKTEINYILVIKHHGKRLHGRPWTALNSISKHRRYESAHWISTGLE